MRFLNPLQGLLSPASVPPPGFLLCLPGTFLSIQLAPAVSSHSIPGGQSPRPSGLGIPAALHRSYRRGLHSISRIRSSPCVSSTAEM